MKEEQILRFLLDKGTVFTHLLCPFVQIIRTEVLSSFSLSCVSRAVAPYTRREVCELSQVFPTYQTVSVLFSITQAEEVLRFPGTRLAELWRF